MATSSRSSSAWPVLTSFGEMMGCQTGFDTLDMCTDFVVEDTHSLMCLFLRNRVSTLLGMCFSILVGQGPALLSQAIGGLRFFDLAQCNAVKLLTSLRSLWVHTGLAS